MLNAWKQYEQTNIRLRYYWEQAWDENGIRRTVLEEDENLIAIEELGEEVEYTGIFRGSVADWRARMLLHKAYQQSGQRNRSVRLCLRLHGYGKRLFLETVYYF